jgi:hypothetical protein
MKVQEHVPTAIQDDRHNVKYMRSQRENTQHCVRDTTSVGVLDRGSYGQNPGLLRALMESTRDYYLTL